MLSVMTSFRLFWRHSLVIFFILIQGCLTEKQRYDGWYNNLANPSWGSAGDEMIFKVPPAYGDLTYQPSGKNRPNARMISNKVFSGTSGLPSYVNRTTLFTFFNQLVAYEIAELQDATCPVEMIRIDVPEDDPDFKPNITNTKFMPFVRSGYNKQTGNSPNNPRRPINEATSWIDGSFIYGNNEVWANCLRSFIDGKLMSLNGTDKFPGLNKVGLPMDNFPSPVNRQQKKIKTLWMFGNAHVHQHPGLASLGVVWFRYHNHVASQLQLRYPQMTDDELYHTARRKVVAVLQNIIMYEWLPALLNRTIPAYQGYKTHVQPQVSTVFSTAAFRACHSTVPPGIYIRDEKCDYKKYGDDMAMRLCNTYWHSQDILHKYGAENIVLGMTSQVAEREDHVIVSDLRGSHFGPLHFSRQDLCTVTIMRGRDHGLADYNTARMAYNLEPIRKWRDINPWLHNTSPEVLESLERAYNGSIDKLDVYPAGLMEGTPGSVGPLFTAIILDQFLRLRDGDRFWFENSHIKTFTSKEIQDIRKTRMKDVIVEALDLQRESVQDHAFFWHQGDPCQQPKQITEEDLPECSPHETFDYFSGSEVSYIISFLAFSLVPFVCIAVACCVSRFKKHKMRRLNKKIRMKEVLHDLSIIIPPAGVYPAEEWVGRTELPRSVRLRLDQDTRTLVVLSSTETTTLRTLDLRRHSTIHVWTNSDKRRDLMMVHVPQEYDLVVKFDTELDREEVFTAFKTMMEAGEHEVSREDDLTSAIQKRAITKTKRQKIITAFFRAAFAKAYSMENIPSVDEMEIKEEVKDIFTCELSRREFAEALSLKPNSMFVSQMFSIMDKDSNGYISFKELLYAILLFSRGTCEDKLDLLFRMYDQDNSGSLNRKEVTQMIRSMMEMANTNLTTEEIDQLVDQMLMGAGLQRRNSLRFKDFRSVFSGHMDMLWDVCLDWKGTKQCMPKKKTKTGRRASTAPEYPSCPRPSVAEFGQVTFNDAVEKSSMSHSRISRQMKRIHHYVENHRLQIIWLIIFFSANVAIFCERFYFYAIETEHMGFRQMAGQGISVTRGAAACMSFCFSILLLTVCQNTLTQLRETVLNRYIPFDSAIGFHKIVAYAALFFTAVHVFGYGFNFYHMVTQPVQFLCIFNQISFNDGFLPKIHFWLFGNLIGMTGVLLIVVIMIIFIFATQTARTHIFSAFWITHKLFWALYILTLLHGASGLVQHPYFPYYFVGPATIFLMDKMVSLSRRKQDLSVVSAELLQSDVTKLEFKRPSNFEYRSGQWVRFSVNVLGSGEYHSLTLTSAPHEDTLSVHIRALGPWSWNLRRAFDPELRKNEPYSKVCIDGPFGAGQQDWFRYEVSVLVGGGIGVTPYASILKDLFFMSSVKNTFRLKCQKVYFVWVTGSQKQFEWLIDILRQVEQADSCVKLEIHIFITQFFQEFDLRTTMLYVCEEHFQKISGTSMFTGLKAKTHFGRPTFEKVLEAVKAKHQKVRKIGVFSCGPAGLTKSVQQACHRTSGESRTLFEHHFENF